MSDADEDANDGHTFDLLMKTLEGGGGLADDGSIPTDLKELERRKKREESKKKLKEKKGAYIGRDSVHLDTVCGLWFRVLVLYTLPIYHKCLTLFHSLLFFDLCRQKEETGVPHRYG